MIVTGRWIAALLGFRVLGECQSGCRTGFVTSCVYPGLVSVCTAAGWTRMSRFGLSVMAPLGDQSRVCLLQRLG